MAEDLSGRDSDWHYRLADKRDDQHLRQPCDRLPHRRAPPTELPPVLCPIIRCWFRPSSLSRSGLTSSATRAYGTTNSRALSSVRSLKSTTQRDAEASGLWLR